MCTLFFAIKAGDQRIFSFPISRITVEPILKRPISTPCDRIEWQLFLARNASAEDMINKGGLEHLPTRFRYYLQKLHRLKLTLLAQIP